MIPCVIEHMLSPNRARLPHTLSLTPSPLTPPPHPSTHPLSTAPLLSLQPTESMNIICGFFLRAFGEENSFWLLSALCENVVPGCVLCCVRCRGDMCPSPHSVKSLKSLFLLVDVSCWVLLAVNSCLTFRIFFLFPPPSPYLPLPPLFSTSRIKVLRAVDDGRAPPHPSP